MIKKKRFSYTHATGNGIIHIDYIAQGSEATSAWTTFIIDSAKGCTRADIKRINDSIRTHTWAILGAQSQTKTDILGTARHLMHKNSFLLTSKTQLTAQ